MMLACDMEDLAMAYLRAHGAGSFEDRLVSFGVIVFVSELESRVVELRFTGRLS